MEIYFPSSLFSCISAKYCCLTISSCCTRFDFRSAGLFPAQRLVIKPRYSGTSLSPPQGCLPQEKTEGRGRGRWGLHTAGYGGERWKLDLTNVIFLAHNNKIISTSIQRNLVTANNFCQSLGPWLYRGSTVLVLLPEPVS